MRTATKRKTARRKAAGATTARQEHEARLARENRDRTGWRPADYTSGPLAGIPALVILPSVRLLESGLSIRSDPGFLQALGTLEVVAAGRPIVERAGSSSVYFSPGELKALLATPGKDVDSWLADEVPADSKRVAAANEELQRVRTLLRTMERTRKARSYRDERAALLDERLRRDGVPTDERRWRVAETLGMKQGTVPMALHRGRMRLGLPPRQKRSK